MDPVDAVDDPGMLTDRGEAGPALVEAVGEIRFQLLRLARAADAGGRDADRRTLLDARFLLADRASPSVGPNAPPLAQAKPPRTADTGRDIELHNRQRLDKARLSLALLLILILGAVSMAAVIKGSADFTQALTPISGLAGIAIGWLFSGSGTNDS